MATAADNVNVDVRIECELTDEDIWYRPLLGQLLEVSLNFGAIIPEVQPDDAHQCWLCGAKRTRRRPTPEP